MDFTLHHPTTQPSSERKIKHYSNFHQILLVGEGDFSFSFALANAFGSAKNMVPTSLDSREKVESSYKSGKKTLQSLETFGAMTLHGVDATTMDKFVSIRKMKFDRIVYNFPPAGFFGKEEDERVIKMHRHLLEMFFKNARIMLSGMGEIHVSIKECYPYNEWKLVEQAEKWRLVVKESVKFDRADYPGYTTEEELALTLVTPSTWGTVALICSSKGSQLPQQVCCQIFLLKHMQRALKQPFWRLNLSCKQGKQL